MEPISTLVSTVMGVLMPYVSKGAQEFARVAGEAAYNKAKGLLDMLRAKFGADKEAADSLTRLEEKPERYRSIVEDILNEKLAKDKELATDVDKHLKEMGPELQIIQKLEFGERVTGLRADEMTSGKATVTQTITRGSDVTGAEIKRIGG